jgi:sec-independent protein translocase protein TatA
VKPSPRFCGSQTWIEKRRTSMFGLRVQELLIILLIVLVLFGASKIPQMMRGFGEGIKEFKKGMKDEGETKKEDGKEGGSGPADPGTGGGGNGHPA